MILSLVAADLIMAAAFVWTYNKLPPQLPLLYSRLWGEGQLVDTWFIFILPLILHFLFFFNLYLYSRVFLPNELVRHILHILNWFLIVVTTIFFVRTLFFIT